MHPGNLKMATRAARRGQELVHLIEEQGLHPERARLHLGISERSAKRYRQRWGSWSADLRPHWSGL
jgi:hypothetical protein